MLKTINKQSKYYQLKHQWYVIIFGTHTPAGKLFDVILLYVILGSVTAVLLESVPNYHDNFWQLFEIIEWTFTILFSIEYVVRIIISPNRKKYIFSYWGIIDLLAVIPTYLSLFVTGYHYLGVIRALRLLRVFRIFKLSRFGREARILFHGLKESSYKITVFLASVITIIIVMGTIMFLIEEGNPGFKSIPESIYWSIVTVTTVGFGDVTPITPLGKFFSSIMMIIGYAIIAVPTGIVTVAFAKKKTEVKKPEKQCSHCSAYNEIRSNYCSNCGVDLRK